MVFASEILFNSHLPMKVGEAVQSQRAAHCTEKEITTLVKQQPKDDPCRRANANEWMTGLDDPNTGDDAPTGTASERAETHKTFLHWIPSRAQVVIHTC
jgi:hypothetical protein